MRLLLFSCLSALAFVSAVHSHPIEKPALRNLLRSAHVARFVTSLPDGPHVVHFSVWDDDSNCLCKAIETAQVKDECYTLSLKPALGKLEPFTQYRVVLRVDKEDTISIPIMVLPIESPAELDPSQDSMLVYLSYRGDDLTPIRFVALPPQSQPSHISIAISSALSDLGGGTMPLISSNAIRVDAPSSFVLFHQMIGVSGRLDLLPDGLGLFASGLTVDVNGDGRFMLTAGVAAYDNGQVDYVIAPFVGFDYVSSRAWLYVYSEIQACVNSSTFLSGELGFGSRLSEIFDVRAGFGHTEIAVPLERDVRFFDGIRAALVMHR